MKASAVFDHLKIFIFPNFLLKVISACTKTFAEILVIITCLALTLHNTRNIYIFKLSSALIV